MNQVQSLGDFEPQFREILGKALDKTVYGELTTHATPDTEFSLEHGLGYVPNGYAIISIDKAGVVYKGSTAWTESMIYWKCNVSSCVIRAMVF